MDDKNIIELYRKRDEKAIEETDAKYGNYIYSISYNILRDREDSEECRNDTYLDTSELTNATAVDDAARSSRSIPLCVGSAQKNIRVYPHGAVEWSRQCCQARYPRISIQPWL